MTFKKYIAIFGILLSGVLASSCSDEPEILTSSVPVGVPLSAEAKIEGIEIAATRATTDNYDGWSFLNFNVGDKVGLFSLTGIENPDKEGDFSKAAKNLDMTFEGRYNGYNRFGNSEHLMDPATLADKYCTMYYPYYEDMPTDIVGSATPPGLPLRKLDPNDGIEKCVDFLRTSSNNITITNGVLRPTFSHYFYTLVLQRGEGFRNAEDKRIWVVMQNPYTDIRVKQTTATGTYSYSQQYNPPEGEDPMDYIEGVTKFRVNKHSVWQAWDGPDYNGIESKYVVCPYDYIFFILIQDDYGTWQNVTDFTLYSTTKRGYQGYRYTLTIELDGLNVVVRPVSVTKWDDEINISDNRPVGIDSYEEYLSWVATYNLYTTNQRNPEYEAELLKYGDAERNTETGEVKWTFYINHDITFPDNGMYRIIRLDDVLEGSSTYTNYTFYNLRSTLIGEIGEKGALRALDFRDLYIIQPESETEATGAICATLNGGRVEYCNIYNGIMIGRQATGMVAGVANGGAITGCSFSGDVIGSESDENYDSMFGIIQLLPTITDTNSSDLKFIEN